MTKISQVNFYLIIVLKIHNETLSNYFISLEDCFIHFMTVQCFHSTSLLFSQSNIRSSTKTHHHQKTDEKTKGKTYSKECTKEDKTESAYYK